MRALILMLAILGILASAPSAKAGLSTSPRETPSSADTASASDESNQQSEDQIGLTRAKRRDVQRGLTRLGFDTRIDGRFEEQTREAIGRWQEGHGYPRTGFLNTAQYKALVSESSAAAQASRSDDQDRRRGGRARHSRGGIGGPIGAIGHMVGGLLGR
jgi:peptidoglycan hydrolase-like protein with peptidoglycan-binding domain